MSRKIVQIRYNLGSLKIQLSDEVQTVGDLKRLLCAQHALPLERMELTRDQRNQDRIECADTASLVEAEIRPGMTVFLGGRYEKVIVEKSYVSNGVVTAAGERIMRCPTEGVPEAETECKPHGSGEASAVAAGTGGSVVGADVVVGESAEGPGAAAASPEDQAVIDELLREAQLSPEVRRPDRVKKMTLFGPDPEEESDVRDQDSAVARLMELNMDAIAELRLAGLSENEIMEALSIDARGRAGRPLPGGGYRRAVNEQTQALMGGRNKTSTTKGMTGSERRRAAQRARLGIQDMISAEAQPEMMSTRPSLPRPVDDTAFGEVGNSCAELETEESVGTIDGNALESEDIVEQQALMRQFEQEQRRKLEAARLRNERTLDSLREKSFRGIGGLSLPVEPSSVIVPLSAGESSDTADGAVDSIDLSALSLDPDEVAVQRALMERFESQSRRKPLPAPDVTTSFEKVSEETDLKSFSEEIPRPKLKNSNPPQEILDVDSLDMDPGELEAQLELLQGFEKARQATSSSQAAAPSVSTPPERVSLAATGRTPEQLMAALGFVADGNSKAEYDKLRKEQQEVFDRFSGIQATDKGSRGVLARPAVNRKGSGGRSKILADSAVEVLSNASKKKPIETMPSAINDGSRVLPPRPSEPTQRQSFLDVSSSRDDIQISSRQHGNSNNSRQVGPTDPVKKIDGAPRKTTSADLADRYNLRSERFPLNPVSKAACTGSSGKPGPRAHGSDTRSVQREVDTGFLTIGAAPVTGRTSSVKSNNSARISDKTPVSDIPSWLKPDTSRPVELAAAGAANAGRTSATAAPTSARREEGSNFKKSVPVQTSGSSANSPAVRKPHRSGNP